MSRVVTKENLVLLFPVFSGYSFEKLDLIGLRSYNTVLYSEEEPMYRLGREDVAYFIQ
jgi:hypothetical protein